MSAAGELRNGGALITLSAQTEDIYSIGVMEKSIGQRGGTPPPPPPNARQFRQSNGEAPAPARSPELVEQLTSP